MDKRKKIITSSVAVAIALIVFGLLLADVATLGNLIIIAIFICVGPYFLYKYSNVLRIRSIEQQFPGFVRDLAEASRSGMSLPEAISIASQSHYGKLTPEVVKMNNMLSWGTPFMRVLDIFGEKFKKSRIITESIEIIKQSYESGGSIPATLDSVAKDITMLQEADMERSSIVKQQVMIMYGIFYIFMAIAVLIIFVMVPMVTQASAKGMESAQESGMFGLSFTDPCENSGTFPCSYFAIVCSFLSVSEGIGCYYVALFFTIVLLQGIFTGLIAGQLGENSILGGGKHSMIMAISALAVFLFLAKAGFFVF